MLSLPLVLALGHIHFVTLSAPLYEQAAKRLTRSAQLLRIFRTVTNFQSEDLKKLNVSTTSGRTTVVTAVLDRVQEGDVVFYADPGSLLKSDVSAVEAAIAALHDKSPVTACGHDQLLIRKTPRAAATVVDWGSQTFQQAPCPLDSWVLKTSCNDRCYRERQRVERLFNAVRVMACVLGSLLLCLFSLVGFGLYCDL